AISNGKTYGSADPVLTATQTGFAAGDGIVIGASRATGEGVGSYVMTPSASGAALSNYTVTFVNGAFTIAKKALTASITADDKPYDGTAAATISACAVTGMVSGDEAVGCTATGGAFSSKTAGIGKTVTANISLTGTAAGNYSFNSTASDTADISKLAITGSITASNKVYDGNTSATISGRSLFGVLVGDTVSLTGGTATFADKNDG